MGTIRFTKDPNQQGGEWEPLPRGTYNMEVEEAEERTSSNGNPQVMVKTIVIDGPHGGKRATHFFTLTPKAAFRFEDFILALGMQMRHEGKDDAGNDIFAGPDTDELTGRQFTCDATVRSYEGKDNNDFSKYRALGAKWEKKQTSQAPGSQPGGPIAPPAGFGQPQPQGGYTPPPAQPGAHPGTFAPQHGGGYQQPAQGQYPPQGFAPPGGYPQQPGYPPAGPTQGGYQQPPQQPPYGGQPPPDRRGRPGS